MSKNNEYNNNMTVQENVNDVKDVSAENNDSPVKLLKLFLVSAIAFFFAVLFFMIVIEEIRLFKDLRDLQGVILDAQEHIEQSADGSAYLEVETSEKSGMLAVPEGCYFVMGDSRSSSDNAFVSRDEIIARVDLCWRKQERKE